ncbi:hotdog fold domain-containing protein [Desulfococcaceae bacterium HSG9]|nr:hotdog fold domain-containing protein [Desulfococcaceae bacterium HSG9]
MKKSNALTETNKLALNRLENFDKDRGCFACGLNNPIGLKMEFYSDGQTVFSWLTVPQNLCGWRNIIHGGIITTIMDEAMSWTAHHLIKKLILTKTINVQFLHPLYVEKRIQVEGRVALINGEREAELTALIINDSGKKCAQATGTFALLKPKTARRMGVIDETIIRNFEQHIEMSNSTQ